VGNPTMSRYSFEFKLDVVGKVLYGAATVEWLAHEYELSSGTLVQSWVRAYRRYDSVGL
jgi:transposase